LENRLHNEVFATELGEGLRVLRRLFLQKLTCPLEHEVTVEPCGARARATVRPPSRNRTVVAAQHSASPAAAELGREDGVDVQPPVRCMQVLASPPQNSLDGSRITALYIGQFVTADLE